MSGYVVACYAVTIGSLSAYSIWAMARLRAVNKRGQRQ
ncbi:MAG: hypothetical protein QOG90_1184 [Actinomycetota bacterium]|jgi:hypothetical protein